MRLLGEVVSSLFLIKQTILMNSTFYGVIMVAIEKKQLIFVGNFFETRRC